MMLLPAARARRAALSLLLLCVGDLSGCAGPAQSRPSQATRQAASSTASAAPRRVRVVSADVAPRIPTTGWQPSTNQSVWTGFLVGGGAGAGVGLGVCTVSLLCPPCYAACVAALGIGGATAGAFGGRIAHRELASDPANRMLPVPDELSARFRARTIATLSAQGGITAEDGGTASLSFARDGDERTPMTTTVAPVEADSHDPPPDRVLEIALTDIHADALRKGGFEVAMKARARLRDPRTGSPGDVEKFEYDGKRIREGGGIEAEAARIAADVDRGMNEMAKDIQHKLLEDD
ncbi:MAG: hypothetical protein K2Y51_24970 [Gammaproteobacteria bacterium]|nr:hypothetical protein [Gammaproteobacteria bacterium]